LYSHLYVHSSGVEYSTSTFTLPQILFHVQDKNYKLVNKKTDLNVQHFQLGSKQKSILRRGQRFGIIQYFCIMTSHEKYLRHSLRTACDSEQSSDLQLISSDGGRTFCHQFLLISLLPQVQDILCSSCSHFQDSTIIIIPDVTMAHMDMARDYLYMFGDVEPLRKIFGINENQLDIGEDKDCIPSFPGIENKVQKSQPLKETVNANKKVAPFTFDGELKKEEEDSRELIVTLEMEHTETDPSDNKPDETVQRQNDSEAKPNIPNPTDPKDTKVQKFNKLYSCEECSYKTKYKFNMPAHRNTHTDKTFTCDQCGFETKWRESLNRHMLMEAGIKHSCNECDYQAFDKRNLRKHIVTKHEGFRYTCDQCDYSCKIQKSLVKHKKGIHHTKISKCGQCKYNTISKGNLKRHIDENHSGLGYQCNICEVLYRSQNAVKYHKQKKHPTESFDNTSE
jgi:hypothetical protein